LSNISKIGK
jgi:hypothetical protein